MLRSMDFDIFRHVLLEFWAIGKLSVYFSGEKYEHLIEKKYVKKRFWTTEKKSSFFNKIIIPGN